MVALTKLDQLAESEGFIAVFPNAYKKNWNDGRGALGIPSQKEGIDDITFTKILISQLSYKFAINTEQIFALGFSNGALFTYLLACKVPHLFAGFAAIGGLMPLPLKSNCQPSMKKPMIIIAGDSDPVVPYEGGDVGNKSLLKGSVLSAKETLNFWETIHQCDPNSLFTDPLPDDDKRDDSTLTMYNYSSCDNTLSHIRVNHGGHTWPGGPQYLPRFVIGTTNNDIDASKWIWNKLNNFKPLIH